MRTSIALMGFGFVIVKFALFIRQMALFVGQQVHIAENRFSGYIGVTMVGIGACITLLAFIRYRRIQQHIEGNSFFPSLWLSILVTTIIVVTAVLLVIYLVPNLR